MTADKAAAEKAALANKDNTWEAKEIAANEKAVAAEAESMAAAKTATEAEAAAKIAVGTKDEVALAEAAVAAIAAAKAAAEKATKYREDADKVTADKAAAEKAALANTNNIDQVKVCAYTFSKNCPAYVFLMKYKVVNKLKKTLCNPDDKDNTLSNCCEWIYKTVFFKGGLIINFLGLYRLLSYEVERAKEPEPKIRLRNLVTSGFELNDSKSNLVASIPEAEITPDDSSINIAGSTPAATVDVNVEEVAEKEADLQAEGLIMKTSSNYLGIVISILLALSITLI